MPHLCPRTLLCAALTSTVWLVPDAHAQLKSWTHPDENHPDRTTHWYRVVAAPRGITWDDANRAAASNGGHLATISSKEENDFLFSLVDRAELWTRATSEAEWTGPWIGGVQPPGSQEPAGGWAWSELESPTYANWAPGKPDNADGADRICFGGQTSGRTRTWTDVASSTLCRGFVIEFAFQNAPRTAGLLRESPASSPGYTLFNPLFRQETYLIDLRGRVVNSWKSQYRPGASVYLRDNGNLLRCSNVGNVFFQGFGGSGGLIEEFDWDDKLVWSFRHSTERFVQHHDIEELPNGNVLVLAWEYIPTADAIAAGRDPKKIVDNAVWPEKILEVKKLPNGGSEVVWEWHAWDHIVQDHDKTKANYGDVAAHPELIDLNYTTRGGVADWMHANALAYNADLDQIMISPRSFGELWIIDHSTTTAEAAAHTGGRSGKGGDLLYRWGNPAAYRAGTAADRKLWGQHNTHWIEKGKPGAGNVLYFNNGLDRPEGPYSSVEEIVLPETDSKGNYPMTGRTWAPKDPIWIHTANQPEEFFSRIVSGTQRLANGNTLICGGWNGNIFEVTRDGAEVWRYRSPVVLAGRLTQGTTNFAQNGIFRAMRYPADFPGFRGRDLTPQEPLETQPSVLLVDGSTMPRQVVPGTTVQFTLRAAESAGALYFMATSSTSGRIPIGYRHMNLGRDELFLMSITGIAPSVFRNYLGRLDTNGTANASMVLPNVRDLVGIRLHSAFLVYDPSKRSSIAFVSNTVDVQIVQ